MFDGIFGWRKASKCKKLIRRVQCRLRLLRNKRASITRHLRDDVGQLLRSGHDQIAFNRVDQLIKDESIMTAYELLDHFCEFIVINLPYIRKNKDCPNDVNEAVSSLIFASARCGDLPELRAIRNLFGERYGQRFATAGVELLPGSLVNCQLKEKLSITLVPDHVKHRLMDDIAREYCCQPVPLSLEYSSELQLQKVKKDAIEEERAEKPTHLNSISESAMTGAAVERARLFLNEIEEFRSSIEESGNFHDQRLFMFKSVMMPKGGVKPGKLSYLDRFKSCASSRDPRKRREPTKRPGMRSLSLDKQTMKDVEFAFYYGEYHQKKMPVKQIRSIPCYNSNREEDFQCSLESPCYCCTNDHRDFWRSPKAVTNSAQFRTFDLDRRSMEGLNSSRTKSPSERKAMQPSYVRATTMPVDRPEDRKMKNTSRSNSLNSGFSSSSPGHVHPKLPDYKELEATFRDLRRAYLHTTHLNTNPSNFSPH